MELLLVGVGGMFGSLARFQIGKLISERARTTFPIGTFLINISGAFLLGFLTSIDINTNLNLLLGEGFLGAFTTFSTFMYEGFNLFQENEKMNAFIYIISTLILGVVGFVIGFAIAQLIK